MKRLFKDLLARRVWGGPFRGMRYVSKIVGGTPWPRILGTYEKEIAGDVLAAIKASRSVIVDVGAAEGYYAVGALRVNPLVGVIAYDSSPDAQRLCRQMSVANGVDDRLTMRGACAHRDLLGVMQTTPVDLLIIDVEGYEDVLLDDEIVQLLSGTRVIAEVHESYCHGVGERLKTRFVGAGSHHLREIIFEGRTWRDVPSPLLRWYLRSRRGRSDYLLWERPPGGRWLIATPWALADGNAPSSQPA